MHSLNWLSGPPCFQFTHRDISPPQKEDPPLFSSVSQVWAALHHHGLLNGREPATGIKEGEELKRRGANTLAVLWWRFRRQRRWLLFSSVHVFLRVVFVRVNIPDQEDLGEEALQSLSLQRSWSKPQLAIRVTSRIRLNVEKVKAITQWGRAVGTETEELGRWRRFVCSINSCTVTVCTTKWSSLKENGLFFLLISFGSPHLSVINRAVQDVNSMEL